MTDNHWQLAAYVFVSITLWMVAAQLWRRQTNITVARFLSQGWAASILSFVYYIGLPYVALILGVVPGRYLGLAGVDQLHTGLGGAPGGWGWLARLRADLSLLLSDWLPDIGTMASLGTGMLLLLVITWGTYGCLKGRLLAAQPFFKAERSSVMRAVYQVVHWSFYRSAIWLLTDDLYLAVVGGIALVGLEWLLDAGWLEGVWRASHADTLLIDASLLITTSTIFFFVPNVWLVLPVHWLLAVVSRHMLSWGHGYGSSRVLLRG